MYLCRSFDQLNHGQDYSEVKPVVHIGFLNYTLFEDTPEFYTTYKLINVKSNREYTDSLTLHVIDLSHIELASEEDRKYHIHEWAMLFKADTWEEIRMIASKDKYLEEASQTMFRMSADDLVRKRCRDREELIERPVYDAPTFTLNPDIKDFYEFTRNDVKVENYVTGPQVENIPVAI